MTTCCTQKETRVFWLDSIGILFVLHQISAHVVCKTWWPWITCLVFYFFNRDWFPHFELSGTYLVNCYVSQKIWPTYDSVYPLSNCKSATMICKYWVKILLLLLWFIHFFVCYFPLEVRFLTFTNCKELCKASYTLKIEEKSKDKRQMTN